MQVRPNLIVCEYSESHLTYSPTAVWRNVFLLILTAAVKVLLTAWTFGMMVGDSVMYVLVSCLLVCAIGTCGYFPAYHRDRCMYRPCDRVNDVSRLERSVLTESLKTRPQSRASASVPSCMGLLFVSARSFRALRIPRLLWSRGRRGDAWRRHENDR